MPLYVSLSATRSWTNHRSLEIKSGVVDFEVRDLSLCNAHLYQLSAQFIFASSLRNVN
jgi:hypothetical protein